MRSIYRSKQHSNLINILTDKDSKIGIAAFSTIKSLQCYAAVLGFDQGRRETFERKNSENIEWHTFSNDDYTQYIYLIALAETNTIDVLRYDVENSDTGGLSEDMVRIFEEYAHGGFHILQSWMDRQPGDPYGSKALISGLHKASYLKEEIVDKKNFGEVEF